MLKVFIYDEDFGRSGSLNSVFLAEEKAVAKMYGHDVYLGEVLGKHSDVEVFIDENSFEVHEVDATTVEILHRIFGDNHICGCDLLGAFQDQLTDGEYGE